ncbi:uncharacterized protein LOC116603955 isoform X1 [Nematostella vectensis]|uniref:uncharacterized protein LOC116603955 isoform X1 n=2 Tax=Nematostella vectensis TaxID=45351 RepID=UPI0020776E71|nr:uncharacterized protein LOC116603955 isoform X1 [Nematostella vectensis]XP_048575562.1 uncharacterized protein LOC116603955 isoform X1 [Nematostella vectensis]XP_048575563.1 uncharacterized protein LOC116603955 isoform X1 [Nematostella vectensis]XP_048575564.1 uncharacterized protein LOC116603955 isoform X1 [Nematostella vectensis]
MTLRRHMAAFQGNKYDILLVSIFISTVAIATVEGIPQLFAPGVTRQHGVYIEKWEGVDSYEIENLLKDPRYPNLPTWRGYASAFTQPANWGENFGTRIRTYFVPQQSGPHVFYISANNQGELYLSTDEMPEHKSMIASISGLRRSDPNEFEKYSEQRSWPAQLTEGKYYYMEILMKEYFSDDHLVVAVKTPDGKFYAPIPSQFLWTTYLSSSSSAYSHTSQLHLMKIAARAGARAGAHAGESAASHSGARAGAAAGAAAGAEGGAKAGAEAAAKAARIVMNKAISLALKAYTGPGHVINIHLNKNGVTSTQTVASQSSPQTVGGTSSGTSTGGLTTAAGGSTGASSSGAMVGATTGSASSAGASAGGGGGVGTTGGSTGAAGGGGGGTSTSTGSSGSTGTSTVTSGGGIFTSGSSSGSSQSGASGGKTIFKAILPDGTVKEGMLYAGMEGNENEAVSQVKDFVYQPKAGEDPDEMARKFVHHLGMAKKIVIGAKYTVHSTDIPAKQPDASLNHCLKSKGSQMIVDSGCQYFIIRKGHALKPSKKILSLESICTPGYFVVQRNFRFYLEKNDGTDRFKRQATLKAQKIVANYFSFLLMTKDHDIWFLCETPKKTNKWVETKLTFAQTSEKFKDRCSFNFFPLPVGQNDMANCYDVLDVTGPKIPGHQLKQAATEAKEMCVAIEFKNTKLITFKLITDVNDKEYLVSEGVFKLRVIVKRPELHPQVLFKAEDPNGERRILLNGDKTIAVVPKEQCDDYLSVEVTSKKATFSKPEKEGSVHYHYHYHPAVAPSPSPPPSQQTACSPACQPTSTCLPSCPSACCSA